MNEHPETSEGDTTAPGVLLAVHLNGCIIRVYGGAVPFEDVMVAATAILNEYLGRVDPVTADAYRSFVIDRLASGASRQ